MRTADEKVESLHARMQTRRRRRERRITSALAAACVGLTLCLGALVFGGAVHAGGTASMYSGATILFSGTGAYVLTAVLAFFAGVLITAICFRLRKRAVGPGTGREETGPDSGAEKNDGGLTPR